MAFQLAGFDQPGFTGQISQVSRPPVAAPTAKGSFLTHLFPTVGGVGGGALGGAAGGALAGTAVLPGVGTVAGGLIGALLGGAAGGAAGKVAENKVEGQSLGSGVAGQAAEQGLLSAGPLRLLKGAKAATTALKGGSDLVDALNGAGTAATTKGLAGWRVAAPGATAADNAAGTAATTSLAGKAKTFSNAELLRQYPTISKPVARATNPMQTVSQLADAGILKPQDAEKVAGAITGTNGILNKAVGKAVGSAKGVDTSGVEQVFKDALGNNGVVANDAKSLTGVFKAQMNRLNGGAQGTLSPTSNPNDVMDVMRSLEAKSNELLGKGGTYHLPTSADKAKASVLNQVKSELQDRLYQGAGANGNVTKILTPQLRDKLVNLLPGNSAWANHVDNNIMKSADVAGLRSAQKPFVNISKIISEGENNAATFGGRATVPTSAHNLVAQGVQTAVNSARQPAARALAGALRGGTADTAGNVAKGATNAWSLPKIATRSVVGNGLIGALTGANGQSANAPMTANANNTTISQNMPQLSQTSDQTSSNSPFDPANIEANIQKIVASGGSMKDVSDYVSLASSINSLQAAAAKADPNTALTTNQKNEVVSQQKALESLNAYAGQLQGAGGAEGPLMGALNSSILGNYTNPAAKGIDAQRIDVASSIAGALNPRGTVSPVTARIISDALPSIHDTPKVAQAKIANLITQIKSGAFSADTPVNGIISNGQ